MVSESVKLHVSLCEYESKGYNSKPMNSTKAKIPCHMLFICM